MQVAYLLELLKDMPKNAHVTINGEIVNGIELISGNVEAGYYNPHFIKGKGKASAIRFTLNQELSTGEVINDGI